MSLKAQPAKHELFGHQELLEEHGEIDIYSCVIQLTKSNQYSMNLHFFLQVIGGRNFSDEKKIYCSIFLVTLDKKKVEVGESSHLHGPDPAWKYAQKMFFFSIHHSEFIFQNYSYEYAP